MKIIMTYLVDEETDKHFLGAFSSKEKAKKETKNIISTYKQWCFEPDLISLLIQEVELDKADGSILNFFPIEMMDE